MQEQIKKSKVAGLKTDKARKAKRQELSLKKRCRRRT